MKCEQVRDQLPDYSLGTLSEVEVGAVRRHLRGCAACRREAAALDEGVVMFASAAAIDPPAGLKSRVLSVLAEESTESGAGSTPPRPRWLRPVAAAAVAAALAGALAWGGVSSVRAARLAEDASSYRTFLHALGGLDVRVAPLHPRAGVRLEGSAILYDSDRGQSWVLITVRTIGYQSPLTVTLSGANGRSIRMPFPIKLDADGDGATWLVTAANIKPLRTVVLRGPDGVVVASGTAPAGHSS